MVINKRRARKDEDKEARRTAILAAAARLIADRPPTELKMAEVAAGAGLAKGTLYLYFATREELLLALLVERLWRWLDDVDAGLATRRHPTAVEIARLFTRTLERHPPLARLLAILQGILEHNLPFATALEFKSQLLGRMAATAALLERALPRLRGQGVRVLLQMNALLIGLQQMADPSEVMARALAEPPLSALRVDFDKELPRAITALLIGMQRA